MADYEKTVRKILRENGCRPQDLYGIVDGEKIGTLFKGVQ